MMRNLFLAATFVTFFLPLSSMAAPEYSSVLPGLAELYKESAPSDLDKKLSKMADDLTPPKSIKELIAFTVKPLLVLGKAHYEAERKCISDGIVAGYTVGVAGGLWSVNPLFVQKRLQMNVSPGGNQCKRVFYAYYNAAIVRGYVEVFELPENIRLDWRDTLTAVIQADRSWLPGSAVGTDGFTYTGNSDNDLHGNLDFYYTYAHAFNKHFVKRSNDDKIDIDVKALLKAVKDGAKF